MRNSPPASYGYGDVAPVGRTMWSAAQTESSPAASACSATSRMACGSSMPIVGNETPYSAMRPLSVILVLDMGIHTTVDTPTGAPIPSFPCAPPPRHSRARHGNTHDRRHTDGRVRPLLATTSAPPHDAPIPLPYLLWPCRMPPRNPASWRRGAPARFTSKCRKMSQNVALFHTPTRRMAHFTSKNLTFLTKTGPFCPVSVHSLRWRPAMVCRCGHSARALSCPRPGAATADVPKGARL